MNKSFRDRLDLLLAETSDEGEELRLVIHDLEGQLEQVRDSEEILRQDSRRMKDEMERMRDLESVIMLSG